MNAVSPLARRRPARECRSAKAIPAPCEVGAGRLGKSISRTFQYNDSAVRPGLHPAE